MSLTRRTFLAAPAVASIALAQDTPREKSGLITGKPRTLRYKEVSGFLSPEQIRWHHESHYSGALRKFTELDKNPLGSHRPRIGKANSVMLHELYFDNMTGRRLDPSAATHAALKKRFGSVDRWIGDFQAAALSCRGWAVLAYHPVNGRLYNIATDSHDDGPSWFGIPLVVVDMYEHAYYLDFQNRKSDYVKGFLGHVDWAEIERRYESSRR